MTDRNTEAPGAYEHLGWIKEINDVPRYYVEWTHWRDGQQYALRHSATEETISKMGEGTGWVEQMLREYVNLRYRHGSLLPPTEADTEADTEVSRYPRE